MKNKTAFTLAEVLVTLAVIGIVASMTIPSLIKSYKKQEFFAKLRVAYSIINQATLSLVADNGGSLEGVLDGQGATFVNAYLPYLKAAKHCADGTCVPEYTNYYAIDFGDTLQEHLPSYYVIVLNNGFYVFFVPSTTSCNDFFEGFQECGQIRIDVNGANPPNIRSYDIFLFHILKDRVIPFGSGGDGYNGGECSLNTHMMGCTTKALQESAINYDFGHW